MQWATKLVSAEHQFAFLKENFADLDESRSPAELADIRAYLSLVEERLAPVTLSLMWANEENYSAATRYAYAANAPFPVGWILRMQERRRVQRFVEERKLDTLSAAYEQAREIYRALHARLAGKPLFFSGRPSTLDVTVAAHIAVQYAFPGPNNKLQTMLREEFPALLAHAQGLLSHYLNCSLKGVKAAPLSISAPAPTRKTPKPLPARYYAGLPKQDEAERREEERRKIARNNKYALGVAFTVLSAVILYKNAISPAGAPRTVSSVRPFL